MVPLSVCLSIYLFFIGGGTNIIPLLRLEIWVLITTLASLSLVITKARQSHLLLSLHSTPVPTPGASVRGITCPGALQTPNQSYCSSVSSAQQSKASPAGCKMQTGQVFTEVLCMVLSECDEQGRHGPGGKQSQSEMDRQMGNYNRSREAL